MTTFTTEDRLNVMAGAEQQGDDDKDYKVLPSTTINGPTGVPYISVIDSGATIRIQLHGYDKNFPRGIYLNLDKRCLSELSAILKTLSVPKYQD